MAAPGTHTSRSAAPLPADALARWTSRRGRELFGVSALRRGWVTPEQLYVALTVQKHSELAGREVARLGTILVHMGAMTPEQVGDVLDEQIPD